MQNVDDCRMFYRKIKMFLPAKTFLQNFKTIKSFCIAEQNKGLICGKRHIAKLTEYSLNIAGMLNV